MWFNKRLVTILVVSTAVLLKCQLFLDVNLCSWISGSRRIERFSVFVFNLLKLSGYVMHHQFNIQQLYALPTLYLCVLYLSENKQRLVPLTA